MPQATQQRQNCETRREKPCLRGGTKFKLKCKKKLKKKQIVKEKDALFRDPEHPIRDLSLDEMIVSSLELECHSHELAA